MIAPMSDILQRDLSRRGILQGAGALIVSFAAPVSVSVAATAATKPPLTPDQLDSFIAVHPDGSATAFFGKIDGGQGTDLGIAQIVAEELDLDLDRVSVVMGDTARSVDQGGASGSTGIWRGGAALRAAAAEARRILLDMAAQKLGAPASNLVVTDGVVTVEGNAAKHVTYGQLIGGQYFNAKLDWNKQFGNPLEIKPTSPLKSPDQYKIVGKGFPRRDVAPKVFARFDYVTDIKVPGMVHGRMIRPSVAGATPVTIDEASIKDIPGVRVVHKDGFLGVVADKEWNAIRAAQMLKVTWSQATPAFVNADAIYDHIRQAPVRHRQVEAEKGSVEQALAGAAKVLTSEYEWPFQSHASMGPACALVANKDGKVTVWTGSQKPHFTRDGVAKLLSLPPERVHAIWVPGPGSYGRNDAGDAALEAALLSKLTGRPVRVQGMRADGIAWDPKGPASVHRGRAGFDAQGRVIAYEFVSKGFSRININTNESDPSHSLVGMSIGLPPKPLTGFGVPAESYGFENKRLAWETIPPLVDACSPLRSAHLRDPVGPQIHFASEQFIDELAAAAGEDAVAFRLKHVTAPRDAAVIRAAAEKAGWQARPGPRERRTGERLAGRGIAYAQRGGTLVAVVAEVEVEPKSGRIWAKKVTVAHDCGLIVNPEGLRYTIEGNVVQGISRTLYEEVRFDRSAVTSVDWMSYPVLEIADTPAAIEVVLIDHPEVAPTGAGEPTIRVVPAAVANAFFDASGVRMRRAPLTPERVKEALSRA